ncbi:hypothetical protein ABZX12_03470 [Kribbella sp. NPDC003505]|uniref:hypothetical protein n=1 Tax=Kribbella sp. NPDC003505 TaxID=3154448 RepID=UPI0033AD0D83
MLRDDGVLAMVAAEVLQEGRVLVDLIGMADDPAERTDELVPLPDIESGNIARTSG